MKSSKKASVELPTTEQIEKERARLRHKSRYSRTLRSTIAILVVVAAVAVLVATLWMPGWMAVPMPMMASRGIP